MQSPRIPENEAQRHQSLCALDILDTPAEARFDRITRIAQRHYGVQIALVSLVDSDRQWFKSKQGLDASQTPRNISFCGHAILADDIFYIPNALEDERFADNPLVTGAPNIRFYAGAPLYAPDGQRVGTLCIIDDKPRQFSVEDLSVLRDLADSVEAELEHTGLLTAAREARDTARLLDSIIENLPVMLFVKRASDLRMVMLNSAGERMCGFPRDAMIGKNVHEVFPKGEADFFELKDRQVLEKTGFEDIPEESVTTSDGRQLSLHTLKVAIKDEQGQPQYLLGISEDITARKVAEEELRRFKRILDRTQDMIFMFDVDTLQFTYLNEGAVQSMGYTRDELLQRHPYDIKPLMPEPEFRRLVVPLLAGKQDVLHFETLHRRKDGSDFPVEVSLQLVREEDGQRRFVAIVRDISERRRIEAEVRSGETRIRAIVDTVVDGIISIDAKGLIRTANPAAERIFGYAREEMLNRNVSMLMPEPYRGAHDGYMRNYLTTGRKKIIGIGREVTGQRKDGSTFPMELAVSEMKVHGERMFTGIVRDITERKALDDASRRYEAIVQSTDDAIMSKTLDGIITSWNRGAERMFGYSADEAIGRPMLILFPEDRQREEAEILGKVSRGEKVDHFETVRRRKDGTLLDISATISPLVDEHGKIIGASKIARDITERKRLERLKNEFISTVSHELRTPLTSIRGALDLVLGKAGDSITGKARKMLEMAARNSERLTLLINDILDLEKIESGRLEFEMKNVDLAALARQALVDNEGYASKHGVRLVAVSLPEQAAVYADAHRLLQVFANLISNAVKYSPEDGQVEVSVQPQGASYRVTVRDHGAGIPAEFRGRIFQRFAQADSSDTREKGGTGLGLSITKAIVERHEGRIDYESEPGKGTAFYFDLPATAVTLKSSEGGSGHALVLICEDNADVASILQEMLGQEGAIGDVAHNASVARQMLADRQYDLMLLDLGLPDADGLQFLQELRTMPATADLPVIVVSGRALEGRKAFTGDAVMVVDWLQKPVDQARLERALREALHRSQRPRILHVEDDLDIIQVTQALLEDMAELSHTDSVAGARQFLSENSFDLVILDLGLADGSGVKVLDELKGRSPVIIFSAQTPDRDITEQVHAALTKSMTSNEQLLTTIKKVLKGKAR